MHDEMVTKSWIKHTWKEAQTFGIGTEDSVVRIPKTMEGDLDLVDEPIKRFLRENLSFHANALWHKAHLQVMFPSEIVVPDEKTKKVWDRESHCTLDPNGTGPGTQQMHQQIGGNSLVELSSSQE